MRITLFAAVVLVLCALLFVSCGDSTRAVTPTSQLAFIRQGGGTGASAALAHPFEFSGFPQFARKMHTGNGRTPFSADIQPGTDSIVLINANGTGEKTVANQGGWFYAVQLSADGKKGVAAAEDTNGWLQIYSVDMKTLNPVQLTTDAEDHLFPQMSADGSKVVFMKFVSNAEMGQAVVMNTSGGTEKVISTPGIFVNFPSFTPDGKQIVFEEEIDDTIDIMNADGTGIKTLTNVGGTAYYDEFPSVSADGKTIAFSRYGKDTPTGGENIYTIQIDGTGLKQLTTDGKSWDPLFVSNHIAFVSYRDNANGSEIYSMNLDGSTQKRLTNNNVPDYFIAFF